MKKAFYVFALSFIAFFPFSSCDDNDDINTLIEPKREEVRTKDDSVSSNTGLFIKSEEYDYDQYQERVKYNEEGEELVLEYEYNARLGTCSFIRRGLMLSNCESTPSTKIELDDENNTIQIENVFPVKGIGECSRYFDLYSKLYNLEKKKYKVVMKEGEYGRYEYEIDLKKEPTGMLYY